MRFTTTISLALFLLLVALVMISGCTSSPNAERAAIIEVVRFQLKAGIAPDVFRQLDRAVEVEHVSNQPGFISRESAASEDGEWLVIVHWRSAEDAEASMASFSSAAATAEFMANLEPDTMIMKRYKGQL